MPDSGNQRGGVTFITSFRPGRRSALLLRKKNDDGKAKRRFSSVAVGRVEKSTVLFHAFHSSLSLCCGKGGKVHGPFPRFPQL